MAYYNDVLKKDHATGIVDLDEHRFIEKINKYEHPHILLVTFSDREYASADGTYVEIEVYTTRLRFVYHYEELDNNGWPPHWKERAATISFEELWKIYDNDYNTIKNCVTECNRLISDIVGDSYKKTHDVNTNLYRREQILEVPDKPLYSTIESFRYSMKDILSLILDGNSSM